MIGGERLFHGFTDRAVVIAGLKPGDVRPFGCFLGAICASGPMTSLADNPSHLPCIVTSGSSVVRRLFLAIQRQQQNAHEHHDETGHADTQRRKPQGSAHGGRTESSAGCRADGIFPSGGKPRWRSVSYMASPGKRNRRQAHAGPHFCDVLASYGSTSGVPLDRKTFLRNGSCLIFFTVLKSLLRSRA